MRCIATLMLISATAATAAGQEYRPASGARVGEVVAIYRQAGKRVPVATDFFSYQAMTKAVLARDRDGLEELLADGVMLLLEPGTPARVLDRVEPIVPPAVEVRILGGPHNKARAYVPSFYVYRKAR